MFKSKYGIPSDLDECISKLNLKIDRNDPYVQFLREYNVVILDDDPDIDYCVDCEGESLPLEVILGFSDEHREDLFEINDSYLDRIPENYLAVASMNYGDLLCISPEGKVYHWDHEVNDLYLDVSEINSYLEQDTDLQFVANSFDEFLSKVTRIEFEEERD